MKGTVSSIEKLGGGFELTIEVPNPRLEKNPDSRDTEERKRFYESEEYKGYLKALDTFERSIRFGKVEIKYEEETANGR